MVYGIPFEPASGGKADERVLAAYQEFSAMCKRHKIRFLSTILQKAFYIELM